ncbi:MAG: glycerophosphodiester phosphodiesterase [Deltaproteobacteria bacterium]|nr:MAG: glycerophosphodiester phosphodiesterase [Deltaproteobacteria bacterium]
MIAPPLPAVVAHRGDSARYPENTLAAFVAALEAGADGIECDARLDGAGRARVFHDDDTARLTGVSGPFAEHPAAELDALRVAGERIPTLDEVASLVAGARGPFLWNVELKPTADAERLVAACLPALRAAAPAAVVVSSFDPRVLVALHRAAPDLRGAYLYEDLLALRALRWLPDADRLDLHPRHDLVDAAHLAEYARPGRAFRSWAVDAPAEASRLAGLGVAAVITNRPGPLRDALRQADIAS